MNSQAGNAAAGGSPSVRARRADGDRIRSYAGSPGTALPHELGHLLAGDALAGGDVTLGPRQPCRMLVDCHSSGRAVPAWATPAPAARRSARVGGGVLGWRYG